MTSVDYILLAPILLGMAWGFYRGFFNELTMIVCLIVTIFLARYLGDLVADFVSDTLNISLYISKPIAFVIIFIVSHLGLKVLARILTNLFKAISLSWLNRLFGGLLGGFKWLIVVSIVLNLVSFFYQKTEKATNPLAVSRFYKPIEATVYHIIPFLDFESFTRNNSQ